MIDQSIHSLDQSFYNDQAQLPKRMLAARLDCVSLCIPTSEGSAYTHNKYIYNYKHP